MDYYAWMPQFAGLFWVFPFLCLAFMVAMMLMMFRRGGCMPSGGADRGRRGSAGETPRQILDRRYASGQLDKVQYEAMRRDLGE